MEQLYQIHDQPLKLEAGSSDNILTSIHFTEWANAKSFLWYILRYAVQCGANVSVWMKSILLKATE